MFQEREPDEWRIVVERVLKYIHQHIDEPITLSELSAVASYSPYHFTRVFRKVTGVSPLYYISAVRIQKSKELLVNTDLTIRDISLEVGLQSLGSFTSSFSEKVGLAPAQYRADAMRANDHLQSIQEVKHKSIRIPYGSRGSVVCGRLTGVERLGDGIVLIGLFTKPVPEGMPAYLHILNENGFYRLANIRAGTYYLLAASIAKRVNSSDGANLDDSLFAIWEEPFKFGQAIHIREGVDLALRPRRNTDPPILVSLPLLMKRYLQHSNSAILEK